MIKLRKAELYDTRQITLLTLEHFTDLNYRDLYIDIHTAISSDDWVLFVVVRNDVVIAYTQCEMHYDDTVVLRRICVQKEWRNKRIGTRMVKECKKWARKNGYKHFIIKDFGGSEKIAEIFQHLL